MIDNVAFTINLFGVTRSIYWYGIIIAMGMLLGIWIATYNARRRGYKPDMVLDISLIAIVCAVIGARIHYVIFSWEYFADGPFWDVFKIWNGGLAIYGGLIGGLIGVALYCKFSKKRFYAITDILVPSLILGQAIGRWGNFANQEAYGWVITNPKLTFFPIAVFIESERAFHMATFFYESMWNLLIFGFLMYYLKKDRREGNILYLYLLLYGIGRSIIETFRTDSQWLFDTGIRVNQLISIILIVFAIIMLVLNKRRTIAQSFKVPFFAFTKKKDKKQKKEQELENINLSDELKIIDDETRKKLTEKKNDTENRMKKEDEEIDTSQIQTEVREKKDE